MNYQEKLEYWALAAVQELQDFVDEANIAAGENGTEQLKSTQELIDDFNGFYSIDAKQVAHHPV